MTPFSQILRASSLSFIYESVQELRLHAHESVWTHHLVVCPGQGSGRSASADARCTLATSSGALLFGMLLLTTNHRPRTCLQTFFGKWGDSLFFLWISSLSLVGRQRCVWPTLWELTKFKYKPSSPWDEETSRLSAIKLGSSDNTHWVQVAYSPLILTSDQFFLGGPYSSFL